MRRTPGYWPAVKIATAPTLSVPAGRCRPAVRGLSASKCRSASRLKAIAAERAAAMHKQNAAPILKASVPAVTIVGRQDGAQKRKRQCKQCVAELHQIKVFANLDDARLLRLHVKRKSF